MAALQGNVSCAVCMHVRMAQALQCACMHGTSLQESLHPHRTGTASLTLTLTLTVVTFWVCMAHATSRNPHHMAPFTVYGRRSRL